MGVFVTWCLDACGATALSCLAAKAMNWFQGAGELYDALHFAPVKANEIHDNYESCTELELRLGALGQYYI